MGISAGFGGGKPSGSAGVGTTSGNATSTTASGITAIAGNTAVRTGDAQTGIKRIFNADRVQQEIAAQVAITAAFGQQSTQAWGGYSNRRFQQALVDKDEQAIACWGPDGGCRSLGHGVVGGLSGGIQGAIGGAATSFAAPHIQAFLIDQGVPPGAAAAITVLTVAGTGSLLGGTPVTAAAFNEASNNNALAFRGIVGAIELAGPIAARACLASPACVKGLRFFGAMAVATVASLLPPAELAQIPGFGGGPLPQQPNNTGNNTPPPQVTTSTPPSLPATSTGPNNTGGNQTANPVTGTAVDGGFAAGGLPTVNLLVMSVDSRLPIPQPTVGANGIPVMSNGRHTPGVLGYNPTTGTEPRNSLDLFNNSVPDPKDPATRYSVDSQGHINRFFGDNNGIFHWSGSTGDRVAPLNPDRIAISVRRLFGFR